jgi:hypothetical protein
MPDAFQRTYPIKHDGDEFYAGRAGERQVLIGPARAGLAALFFDASGTLIETNQRQFPAAFPKYYEEGYDRAFRQELVRYAHDIGFSPRTIHVRRFDATTVGFEIEDCAPHIEEARRDIRLGLKPPAELTVLAEDVARWDAEGLFVLYVGGRELWLDGQGEVHST